MDYENHIGMWYGQPELNAFVEALGIPAPISLMPKRGEDTAYLSSKELGLELTFTEADSLAKKLREYPDGALVLVNIRFYSGSAGDFKRYGGELPKGIGFGKSRKAMLDALGAPSWEGLGGKKQRWETERVWLLASYGEHGGVDVVSLNYPSK